MKTKEEILELIKDTQNNLDYYILQKEIMQYLFKFEEKPKVFNGHVHRCNLDKRLEEFNKQGCSKEFIRLLFRLNSNGNHIHNSKMKLRRYKWLLEHEIYTDNNASLDTSMV